MPLEPQEGQVLVGSLFSEPMRVETVRANGAGAWVLGLVGLGSEQFRRVTLTHEQLSTLTIRDLTLAYTGDAGLLRLGIQAYALGIAFEFDPYFVNQPRRPGCDKIFKEKRSGVDAGRPELKRCLEYLREGDTLLVSKIDRLARSTSDLYRIVSLLAEKGVSFKVIDDPSIDTSTRTGKLVMGILALIAEFEKDFRRERQMDGITKARERGVRFGRKSLLLPETVKDIRTLREAGATVSEINRRTELSKASVYRALAASAH